MHDMPYMLWTNVSLLVINIVNIMWLDLKKNEMISDLVYHTLNHLKYLEIPRPNWLPTCVFVTSSLAWQLNNSIWYLIYISDICVSDQHD